MEIRESGKGLALKISDAVRSHVAVTRFRLNTSRQWSRVPMPSSFLNFLKIQHFASVGEGDISQCRRGVPYTLEPTLVVVNNRACGESQVTGDRQQTVK